MLSLEFDSAKDLVHWIRAEFGRYLQQFLRTFSRVGSIVSKNEFNAKETISPKTK
jgi:hypothetical protein